MKKTIAIILTVLMAVALFTACSSQTAEESASASETASSEAPAATESEAAASEDTGSTGDYAYELGVIQPGPEAYYQNYADSVTAAAESVGMTVTTLLSQYSAETEIANVEDLISRGVDAIACFSTSSDTAQIDAQLCNEANIPLFLMSSTAAEGEGVPACTIGNSFYDMGKLDGDWLNDNFEGSAKILEIQGQLGQGIAEEISRGFADGIAANSDFEIVSQNTANWKRDEAISLTEDALSSGLDFNVIFVHNEDMCAGVINVLEENDMLGTISVITQNGSDVGIELIQDGKVLATCANPPSQVGGDVVVQIMKYFDGEEIPEVFDSPVFMIDASNVNDPDLVTWDKKWAIARVDEYLASK